MPAAALALGTFAVASFAGGMYFEGQNSRAVMKLLANFPQQRLTAHKNVCTCTKKSVPNVGLSAFERASA